MPVQVYDDRRKFSVNPELMRDKDLLPDSQIMLVDGAATIKEGLLVVTKATALAGTMAAPVSGVDDGKRLKIVSTTAAAHVFTYASGKINGGALTLATFAAAIGNAYEVVAYGGVWYTLSTKGVTIS